MDTPSATLPASVRSRACFHQLMGLWGMDAESMAAALKQVDAIGIEGIWDYAREAGEYPEFSPAVFDIAASLGILHGHGEGNGAPPPYVVKGGTAFIPVSGPLSKSPTSLGHVFGGSSTIGMRKALQMAVADKGVQRIMFHIDSPGGTVAGTGDLGDDIHRARSVKPVASYIEDLGASAAYWIASQTGKVYASPHAQVGSIGVISVVQDTSEMAAKMGVKVHVIKTGEGKGDGAPGVPVTKDALDRMQARVQSVHDSFVAMVARGRNVPVETAAKWGDARIHTAKAAKDLGLVDGITSFHEAIADFAGQTGPAPDTPAPAVSASEAPADAPEHVLNTTHANDDAAKDQAHQEEMDAVEQENAQPNKPTETRTSASEADRLSALERELAELRTARTSADQRAFLARKEKAAEEIGCDIKMLDVYTTIEQLDNAVTIAKGQRGGTFPRNRPSKEEQDALATEEKELQAHEEKRLAYVAELETLGAIAPKGV